MTAQTLHGVLYGHGHMGQLHAKKLSSRTGIKLAIVDPNQGLHTATESRPDFAIIATPTQAHAQVALPLLEQGVPCLVEKPLAYRLSDAEDLAQYAHLSVGHIERFNPIFQSVEGANPEYIDIERLAPNSGRSSDIDVIGDLMIHDIDLVLKYMPGIVTDVRAKGVGITSHLPDLVNARIEIAMTNGKTGVANLTASRVSTISLRTWRLFEDGQYWSLDLIKKEGKTIQWPHNSRPLIVDKTDALTSEHDAFLGAVKGQNPYPCTGKEALAALQLAERVRQCLH